jgi:precorrin-4 methylase
MALFLSAARARQLQQELLAGGYPPDTPCVVAYRVSWEDEALARCSLDRLAETVRARRWWKHTLILVGPALGSSVRTRSHLYHPGHFHGHRKAEPGARRDLRGAPREAGTTR